MSGDDQKDAISSIEAIATRYSEGAILADHDKQAQQSIFQLLDVHVILNHYEKERWADVTCTIGHERCAVDYPMKFRGADNLIATSTVTCVHAACVDAASVQ